MSDFTEIAKPFSFLNPGPLDKNRGPYPSVEKACEAIPNITKKIGGINRNLREGKFVDIGLKQPYIAHWWKEGYEDRDLVEYIKEPEAIAEETLNGITYNTFDKTKTTTTSKNTVFLGVPFRRNATINVELRTTSVKMLNVVIGEKIDGKYLIKKALPFSSKSGINQLDFKIDVFAGQFLGISGNVAIGTDTAIKSVPYFWFDTEVAPDGSIPSGILSDAQIAISYTTYSILKDVKKLASEVELANSISSEAKASAMTAKSKAENLELKVSNLPSQLIDGLTYNPFDQSKTTTTSKNTVLLGTPFEVDLRLGTITLRSGSAKALTLVIVRKTGSLYSVTQSMPINVIAGINKLSVDLRVTAGEYIGLSGNVAIGTDTTIKTVPYISFTDGIALGPGGSEASAIAQDAQIALSYSTFAINADLNKTKADLSTLNVRLFSSEQFKFTIDASSTLVSIPTNRTIIRNQKLTKDCVFNYLRVHVATAGILQVGIFELTSGAVFQAKKYSDEITVSKGLQLIALPVAITASRNQYIGAYLKTAQTSVDTSKSSQLGGGRVFTSGKMLVDTDSTTSGASNYDLFSLVEVIPLEEKIGSTSTAGETLTPTTKLPTYSVTASGFTPNPLFIADTFGFNQPLHPTVIYFENGFNGYKWLMCQTPYPQSGNTIYKDRFECPTLHYSNDGISWTAGFLMDDLTSSEITNKDYFSDPEFLWNSDTNTLELWYRITRGAGGAGGEGSAEGGTDILRRTIQNGSSWSARQVMITASQMSSTAGVIRSMGMLYEGGFYKMWFTGITGGNVGYGETPDPLIWPAFNKVALVGSGGVNCWHLDVIRVGTELYMINCTSPFDLDLYKATSNLSFTKIKNILTKTLNDKDFYGKVIYRSAAIVVKGKTYLYVSGWNSKHASIGLMVGDSLETLQLVDGGYVRHDMRIAGNIRLTNTSIIKSCIELAESGELIGFDDDTKSVYFQRADGSRMVFAK